MVQVIRMPMMGNTMERGTLVEWALAEGSEVEEGDLLAVVESEKTAADVVADRDGVLARVDVEEGESVPPGTVLGVVAGPEDALEDAPPPRSRTGPEGAEPDEFAAESDAESGGSTDESESAATESSAAAATGSPSAGETGSPSTAVEEDTGGSTVDEGADEGVRAAPGARKLAAEAGIDLTEVEGTGPDGAVLRADVVEFTASAGAGSEGDRPADRSFASPTTRRLAREHGVSLSDVAGTGVGGRVTESDVRAAVGRVDRSQPASAAPDEAGGEPTPIEGAASAETPAAEAGGVTFAEERELSGVRETIATRMAASAREAPHVTLHREVDVGRAVETAEELSAAGDAAVGFTDLLIAAVVRGLEEHPEFNAWFEDGIHRLASDVNVAIAVDADVGLVTPVVRDADRRTLEGIADERRRLTETVLDGAHTMEDLSGGTFTITNLGMFGVDSFAPIIDPPQVAILAVGRIADGSCTLSLAFDHRPVDGADGAKFLATVAEALEAPSALVARRGTGAIGGGRTDGTSTEPGSDRGATEDAADGAPSAVGPNAVAASLTTDIAERAREVADHHGWPVPALTVTLDGERPTVTVEGRDDLPRATARRLAYAACRESRYADAIPGLRDPAVEVR